MGNKKNTQDAGIAYTSMKQTKIHIPIVMQCDYEYSNVNDIVTA